MIIVFSLDILVCTYTCSTWSDEVLLDYAIDSIQKVMEEECDQYFKEISTTAVKVNHDSKRSYHYIIRVLLAIYVTS